jgi:hypothetical protein
MSTDLITPSFRGNFVFVTVPQFKDKAKPENGKQYSIQGFFPPDTDMSAMEAAAEAALVKKFGHDKSARPKVYRSPFRTAAELDKKPDGISDDWIMMRFSMNEFDKNGMAQKPGVVGPNLQDIIDPTELYSGAWYRCQVNAAWYDKSGNKGVGFYMQNVQKVNTPKGHSNDPIGQTRIPASKAFTAVETAGASADALFD